MEQQDGCSDRIPVFQMQVEVTPRTHADTDSTAPNKLPRRHPSAPPTSSSVEELIRTEMFHSPSAHSLIETYDSLCALNSQSRRSCSSTDLPNSHPNFSTSFRNAFSRDRPGSFLETFSPRRSRRRKDSKEAENISAPQLVSASFFLPDRGIDSETTSPVALHSKPLLEKIGDAVSVPAEHFERLSSVRRSFIKEKKLSTDAQSVTPPPISEPLQVQEVVRLQEVSDGRLGEGVKKLLNLYVAQRPEWGSDEARLELWRIAEMLEAHGESEAQNPADVA